MNLLKKSVCVLLTLAMLFSFGSSYFQASAASIASVKIVRLPDKLKLYRGTDWDYGEWVLTDTGAVWKDKKNLISFLHNPGSGQFPERGMLDMTGLQIKVTYVGGTSTTITYKETPRGESLVTANILVSPLNGKEFTVGVNTMEVYLAADIYKCDTCA